MPTKAIRMKGAVSPLKKHFFMAAIDAMPAALAPKTEPTAGKKSAQTKPMLGRISMCSSLENYLKGAYFMPVHSMFRWVEYSRKLSLIP